MAVEDALQRILARVATLPSELIATPEALDRILAADVQAAINLPPFANSSMDGYAVRAEDVRLAASDSPVTLAVAADIPAGITAQIRIERGQAARIMTGAPLPDGADAVVPVEQTDDTWASDGTDQLPEVVRIFRQVAAGDYVRPVGEDIQVGRIVLQHGMSLRPQDIGILAALGQSTVTVFQRPRVAIISTGDELVDIDAPLAPGKIRNSNSYVLAGLITAAGGIPLRLPTAQDTLEAVRRVFRAALEQAPDLIISTAGVSVGTHDVVRTVVEEMGHVDLWRVNVRPGKPLAFGQVQSVPFFGLPGNPVSAMVTFDIFVRPTLVKMSGRATDDVPMATAILGEDITSDGRRSYLRVTLARENDTLVARLTGTQSSGALLSMVLADGLLIIPEGVTHAPAGSRYPVRLLRG